MNFETCQCQNCRQKFTIEPDDFSFYEKIKVPPPTFCPECRMIRRMSFENAWNIYWRDCDKCGEKTMSMYPPEQKITVYCQKCWWADNWNGTEYAMDYDPALPFLEQIKELNDKTPYSALVSLYTSLKNSDYSNGLAWSKDCYLIFWADYCDNVYYSSILNGLKYSADCLRARESELCYESNNFYKCYRTFFSEQCISCVDVWFSRSCYNCTNCIGCVNLHGAINCIFNVKYSKEEYVKKLKEFGLDSRAKLRELEKKAHEFWLTKPVREHAGTSLNINVTGDYIYESKNSKELYICEGAEDCKWTQFITVKPAKDCMDYSGWGNNASFIYECTVVGENANTIKFCEQCWPDVLNLEYCIWNIAGKNNFGCVNLKRKQYCILNKEYPKEEFEKLKAKIIEDMKINPYVDKLGRKYYYGEFFPLEFSKFPYNKSNAMRFLLKTKERAISEGYTWSDREDTIYEITKSANALPDTITETKEDILKEVIGCGNCGKGYNIAKGEFDLLRKMNLPIPHECPKCRENKRFTRLNKPKLYYRTCAKCDTNIYTPYSPDKPEIVYCVKCYQQEVY